jgi:hypothetical protein
MNALEENRYAENEDWEQHRSAGGAPPEKRMERQSSRSGLLARVKSARNMVRASSARGLTRKEPSERRLTKEPSERRLLRNDSSSSDKKESSERKGAKEDKEGRALRGSSRRSSLGASSDHVARASGSTLTSRVRRGAPARTKSSDNMELTAGGSSSTRRDDLGAATLHGSSVSRIRSQRVLLKESSHRKSSKGDRRSNMKRAMSRENVKRPEEYGPGAAAAAATVTPKSLYGGSTDVRRGRRRPVKVAEEEPAVVHEDEEELAESSDDNSDEDDSFAEEDEAPIRRPGSGRKEQAQPRRDLLALLRDQKTVHQSDFHDKENRRMLHFLFYQHKLGVDLKELQANVDHDIALNGPKAMRRPILPLYVEPA